MSEELQIETCGMGLGTHGVRLSHGPFQAVLGQEDAIRLATHILALFPQQTPVKAKEAGWPLKVKDNPELYHEVVDQMADWGLTNEPGEAFRAGVQWMLDQIHVKDKMPEIDVEVSGDELEPWALKVAQECYDYMKSQDGGMGDAAMSNMALAIQRAAPISHEQWLKDDEFNAKNT